MVDWSHAGATIVNRTTVCATFSPGASAAQINSAIAACASGQVVFLNAGTYTLTTGLIFNNKSNVTLRGAGPDQTFLQFNGGNNCGGLGGDICVINSDPDCGGCSGGTSNSANWTGGYAQGATTITLASVANLQVGSMLHLDQLDDGLSDTGSIWNCQTTNVCSQQDGSSNGRPGRGQNQAVTVTSISGNTVTISPGLYMPNWRAGQNPQGWWSNGLPVVNDGIENLSMDHTNTSSSTAAGTFIYNGSNIWLKNVRDINSQHKHVWIYQSAHVTVRDSYFYGSWNASSESYGVDHYTAADNLVENNIFQHIAQSMMTEGCTGCVFGHNYTIDDYYTANGAAPDWQEPSSWHHSVGDAYILWEGNQGAGFIADDIHGTSHFLTLYRNYWTGLDPLGGGVKTGQTTPLILEAYQRYYNVIGNVLGKPGKHTNYQVAPSSTSDPGNSNTTNSSVYSLGYSGNEGEHLSPIPNDTLEASTLMRWGNYDTATASVRFLAAEVPSSVSLYSNPVPASQTLPASFYLASKPAWWGGTPWPAIGPEVSGGSGPGGHAYPNPAQACFQNTTAGSNGILLFNAANCYGSGGGSTGPAPLSVTTSSVPGGTVGAAYPATTLQAQGGTSPYQWSATGLPGGLALSAAGQLSGTPAAAGTFTVNASVTDSSSPVLSSTKTFTVSVGTAAVPLQVSSVNPAAVTAGGAGFTLVVNGAGFASGAAVKLNATSLATTFVSATQLSAAVPASSIGSAGAASITVTSAGSTSNSMSLNITAGPAISSLAPNNVTAGGAAFTLTVNGTGFASGAAVLWNGSPLATSFVSATQLTAPVSAASIGTAGTAAVSVSSGGVMSGAASLTIAGRPAISSLNPSTATTGGTTFTLTVTGSGFASGAAVWWNGTALTTTFGSATQLTATVPANMIATAGSASITVNSGGITSPAATFTISAGPAISAVNPAAVPVQTTSTTLTVNGSGFRSGAVVRWNSSSLTTTFVSGLQVKATVARTLLSKPGMATVVVASGGLTSNAVTVPVVATAAVTGLSPSSVTAGSPALTLTVNGTNFAADATILWNQAPLTTTFVTASQLKTTIAADLIATAGTAAVSVSSGGMTSAAVNFAINPPAPSGTLTGTMPQVDSGGNWQTTFLLLNTSPGSAQASQSFYNASGNPLALPITLPQAGSAPSQESTVTTSVASNGLAVIATQGSANQATQTGSATLSATGGVGGLAIVKRGNQEAAVPFETRNATSYVFAYDTTNGYDMNIGLQNVSGAPAVVPVMVRDSTGARLGTDHIWLLGNGNFSFTLSNYYTITANLRGTIEFDTPAGGQISVFAVRMSPASALINIPVLANLTNTGGTAPHIASGAGWTTTVVLVNTGGTSAQAHLKFFADSGAPLTLPVSFPQSGATATSAALDQTLRAHATLWLQSTSSAKSPLQTGSLQFTTDGSVGGYVIFSYAPTGQEASATIENRGAGAYMIPFDQTGGVTTSVDVNNGSATPATVPVTIRNDSGGIVGHTSLALPANAHTSVSVPVQFPATVNARGSVEFDTPAGGQINVVGIRSTPTLTFTTLPPLSK